MQSWVIDLLMHEGVFGELVTYSRKDLFGELGMGRNLKHGKIDGSLNLNLT